MARNHDIELNGEKYTIELDEDENRQGRRTFERTFVPTQDTSTKRGEHSLDQWWFEKQTDWSEGEDQKWWDAPQASESRFKDSLNIDISTPGQISLLKDVAVSKALTSAGLPMVVARGLLWTANNKAAGSPASAWNFDATTWTEETGASASNNMNPTALETDGVYVYVGFAATDQIRRGHETVAFADWCNLTGITGLKYNPGDGLMYALSGATFQSIVAAGTATSRKDFGSGWSLVGIDTYQGNHIVFGAGYNNHWFIYEWDGSGVRQLLEMPPGFTLTGLYSLEPSKLMIMGYEDATASGGGIGSVWIYDGTLQFLGHIGSDTASKPYGPYCALRYRNEVRIGWNYQSGLYRYDMLKGGLSKNFNISTVNDKVKGVAFYKGKWYYSIENNGVYAEAATYPDSGWIEGSFTAFNVANKKLLKEAVIELNINGEETTLDQTITTNADYYEPDQGESQLGQTFRAGKSGFLTKVVVKMAKNTDTSVSLVMQLRNVSGGAPGATILATETIPASEIEFEGYDNPRDYVFTFSDPYAVVSGTDYALRFVMANGEQMRYTWWGSTTPAYANGAAQYSANLLDYCLKTYVDESGSVDLATSVDEGIIYQDQGTLASAQNGQASVSLLNQKADNIGYKLTINANTANTVAPIVKSIALKAMPLVSKKGSWDYFIRANEDVDPENRTSWKIFSNLKTAYDLQQVLTLKDHRYPKTSEIYNVMFDDNGLEEIPIDRDDQTGEYDCVIRVRLKEVS